MGNPGAKVAFIAPVVATADASSKVLGVERPGCTVAPVVDRSVVLPLVGPPGVSFIFLVISVVVLPIFNLRATCVVFLLYPTEIS